MSSGFTFSHIIIPSGIHLGLVEQPIAYGLSPIPYVEGESPFQPGLVEICNPMPTYSVRQTVLDEVAPMFERELCEKYKHTPTVTQSQLEVFGEKLLYLGKTLTTHSYDVILVPLRGGLKPWVQLAALTEMKKTPVWVPFTGGSSKKYDEQILWHLEENLAPLSDQARLRIGVIDTAIGGQSSYHLAELLRQCRGEGNQSRWEVDFHLLHDQARFPAGSREIPRLTSNVIHFNPISWPVDGLIVEDWNEAIGLEAVGFDGRKLSVKHCSTDGRLLLKENDGTVRLIESPELHHYTDVLLANAVSSAVATDPLLKYQSDVWQRYIGR